MAVLDSTGLREQAHPGLEELHSQTAYTVSLSVLNGADIVYVDRVRSFHRGQDASDLGLSPGSRLPAYCTAMGKLLLAFLPEEALHQRLADMTLAKQGPNTITSKKALLAELDVIRDEDFAVNDQELAAGLFAIAAPVANEQNEVVAAASLAASSSLVSLEEMIETLGPLLTSTADRISARLGYQRTEEQ